MTSLSSEDVWRRWCFLGLVLFFGSGLLANELTGDTLDDALMSYLSCILVLTVAASMLTYCWIKRGASAPYVLVTLMAWSMAFAISCQAYVRWSWLYRREVYSALMASNWWAYRKIPMLFLAFYLLAWIVGRYVAFNEMKTAVRDGYIPTESERDQKANGIEKLTARIVKGELRFAGHSHEGLILDAKLILKTESGKD